MDYEIHYFKKLVKKMSKCIKKYELAIEDGAKEKVASLAYELVVLEMRIDKEQEVLMDILNSANPDITKDLEMKLLKRFMKFSSLINDYMKLNYKEIDLEEKLTDKFGVKNTEELSPISLREKIDPNHKKDMDALKEMLDNLIYFKDVNKELEPNIGRSYN